MITVKALNKSFEGTQVIKDINGVFEKGQVNMIIGASGTGKSVLLKCMVGLIKPDTGTISYDDREFTTADRDLKTDIRREIGMLFQGVALFDSLNVESNVKFPLDILTNMSESEKLDRANFCLKRVGLENVNKQMPSELSGGMKKRVGIARAIVNNSQYLYCDEPNSGLDPQTSIVIDELIKEITYEFNITTIVVSHDMNQVMGIGDYVMFIHNGAKFWEGHRDEIMHSDIKELKDFVFANQLMKSLKSYHEKEEK